ncbi:hypothetical protein QR680_005035 [Steinernema hermaphroditum]|uniref:G-protein coupled receptors family 3 profile domain-containing protein n=1 Tax=Steinernema hermaphroditum TaxID=289476 RepID=A0AA39LUY3_9BILA|nr:hypothetical protein QR680_005035 [Steinernema hermaphroditum]
MCLDLRRDHRRHRPGGQRVFILESVSRESDGVITRSSLFSLHSLAPLGKLQTTAICHFSGLISPPLLRAPFTRDAPEETMQLSWNWRLLVLLCLFPQQALLVDFSVAGIYTIHNADDGMECDSIVPVNTVLTFFHQRFIAEANEKLRPYGMSLSTYIADSCDDPSVTLRKLAQILGHSKSRCDGNIGGNETNSLLAVTGAFSSEIGDNVNYLLQAFCIPVIESVSSSLSLDDPKRYPYFVRTSPSDIYRTQVIVDLLQSQHFVHVSVIYDGSDFGSSMYNEFRSLIEGCKIPNDVFQMPCVEGAYEIDFHKKTTMNKVEQQLLQLKMGMSSTGVKVYVVFMESEAAQLLFFYLTFWGYKKGDFIFVFAHNHDLLSELTEFSFAVCDHVNPYEKANNILQKQNGTTLGYITNSYMRELIMVQNACCLDVDANCGYSMQCSGDERLDELTDYDMKQIRTVKYAVDLIANALIGIHKKMCPKNRAGEECEAMVTNLTGQMLLDAMMRTSFEDDSGGEFRLHNRSAKPTFDVVQMQDGYWVPVLLDYNPFVGPQVSPNLSEIRYPPTWDEIQRENQVSAAGSAKSALESTCMSRSQCRDRECRNCSVEEVPNAFFNACVPEPRPPFFYHPSGEMYVLFGLAGLGIALCLVSGVVIFFRRQTPMVKASTPDLCFLMVGNLCCMFGISVVMLPSSSLAMCASAWCLSTILLCQTHALFLIKAIRLARAPFFVRLLAIVHTPAKSSLLLCVGFLLLQSLVTTMWILLRPPVIIRLPSGFRYCSSNSEIQTIVLLLIPLILLLLTFLFQKIAGRNRLLFQVRQARQGLAGSLCFIVNYSVLLPLIFIEDQDQKVRAIIFMCIPLLTAYVAFVTMLLPVIWELTFHAGVNKHEYVARERSRQFREGNVMYYIDAIVLRRNRTSTAPSVGAPEKKKLERLSKSAPGDVPRRSTDLTI